MCFIIVIEHKKKIELFEKKTNLKRKNKIKKKIKKRFIFSKCQERKGTIVSF